MRRERVQLGFNMGAVGLVALAALNDTAETTSTGSMKVVTRLVMSAFSGAVIIATALVCRTHAAARILDQPRPVARSESSGV